MVRRVRMLRVLRVLCERGVAGGVSASTGCGGYAYRGCGRPRFVRIESLSPSSPLKRAALMADIRRTGCPRFPKEPPQ